MKSNEKKEVQSKRTYARPQIECIKIDHEITMIMMTDPPGDPEDSVQPDYFNLNPFKLFKF